MTGVIAVVVLCRGVARERVLRCSKDRCVGLEGSKKLECAAVVQIKISGDGLRGAENMTEPKPVILSVGKCCLRYTF